jgi:hypothetical protein
VSKSKSKSKVPRTIRRLFPNVTTCVDATTPAVIEVERRDVTAARRMEADGCAMAKAICRERKADGAAVGLTFSYIIEGNKATRYETPASVAREITSFDRSEIFEPGTYQLVPVVPSHRMGRAKPESSGSNTNRHGKRPAVHKETLNVRNMRTAK